MMHSGWIWNLKFEVFLIIKKVILNLFQWMDCKISKFAMGAKYSLPTTPALTVLYRSDVFVVKTVSASVAFVGISELEPCTYWSPSVPLIEPDQFVSTDRIHFSQIFKNQEMVIGLRVRASYEGQLVTRQGLF